jgi:hypothetical protein
MGGGPKKMPPNDAKWGEELKCQNPRGQDGVMVCTYSVSPDGAVTVLQKMTTETGLDVCTRVIKGGEMELRIGPRQSAKDASVLVEMKRFFVRKE